MGRPREFDIDQALDQALREFWSKGYEGASLSNLTEAMGITRPSLYASFGNKEELFLKVIERYSREHTAYVREAVRQPTAFGVAQAFLEAAAKTQTNPDYPHGCLEMQAALACGDESRSIRDLLASRRQTALALIRDRFQRAIDEGDLSRSSNPERLARLLFAVSQGMAVQASDGATYQDLMGIASDALPLFAMASAGN